MQRRFYKLHGAGNDFVFIDDRQETFPLDRPDLVAHLCHRRYGIGSDGLVVLRKSPCADCRMFYFNSDGKEASFCGNALRCVPLVLRACGHPQEEFLVETKQGVMSSAIRGEQIETSFPSPAIHHWPLASSIYVVEAGVPHAVCLIEGDLHSLPIQEMAPAIRFHPSLAPHGANVTFMQIGNPHLASIRTYERGVEDETLSCGSGAVAAAFVLSKLHPHPNPQITIQTRGKDPFVVDTATWRLLGKAHLVYEGSIDVCEDITQRREVAKTQKTLF